MTKRLINLPNEPLSGESFVRFNPLDYPACFLQPARLSDVRPWQQHIPFAFSAMQMLRPQTFVELGTHKGDSYLAFCQAVSALSLPTKCYAVDTWAGDAHAGVYDDSIYSELSQYHDQHYAGFSRLIRSTFDAAAAYFPESGIDLLHIDGLHTYEAVKHDFETWLPKLSERAVVVFHDINVRERDFGVWRFWNEISAKYPAFAFTHGNGLGVLALGTACPQSLMPLMRLDDESAGAVRQFYFLLGNRLEAAAYQDRRFQESIAVATHTSAVQLDVLRNTMTALDKALDAVGFGHETLGADADVHAMGRHATWTHRALAKLSGDIHQRNLRIDALQTDLKQGRQNELAQRARIDEIAEQNLTMASSAQQHLADHAAALQQIEQLRSQLQEVEAQASELTDLRKHVDDLDLQAFRAHEDFSRLADERDQLQFQLADATEQNRTYADLVATLDQSWDSQENDLSASTVQLKSLLEQQQQLDNERRNLRDQVSTLHRHAANLERSVRDMRASLSWRASAPLRWLGKPFQMRLPGGWEQSFYHAYYSIPGISHERKRALILWLHSHASFLTRNTLSYRLNEQTQHLVQHQIETRSRKLERQTVPPRMTQERVNAIIATWDKTPKISIVTPVYNVDARWLEAAVQSVRDQFYPHWELCIADDASTRDETVAALKQLEKMRDPRIKIQRLKRNANIAGASNVALKMATADYVGLLDHDDALTRDALFEAAQCIVAKDPDMVYSDEDKIDENGFHVEPHFKSDFNQDYLFTNNYICHFSVIRRSLLEKIGGFRPGFDGAQDYDLILRISEQTSNIVHLPLVLYHWRKIAGSTSVDSAAKPQTTEAGRRALTESLQRRGIDAVAMNGPYPNTFRVKRAIIGNPLVSIIIPFRDMPDLLDACVSSILDRTNYSNYEILCINNGSVEAATTKLTKKLSQRDGRVRFIDYDAPFNYSAINNFAATQARGEHLLLLNNDTEIISGEWLESMLEHSQRPEVGVVGAKLLYADNTIQHAGVIIALGGIAGHAHLFLPGDHPGYFARAQLVQNVSAVTFACAMTRRDIFERLGGLNENDVKIAFNDVDYCLRVREAGYLIVYTPYASLYHFESKSRGFEDTPEKLARFHNEVHYMEARHADILRTGDPYYNRNLSIVGGPQNFQPSLDYIDQLPS